jgi:hypothetical protein
MTSKQLSQAWRSSSGHFLGHRRSLNGSRGRDGVYYTLSDGSHQASARATLAWAGCREGEWLGASLLTALNA